MTKYRIKFTRPEEPDTIAADGFANIKEAADALPKIITRCATVSIEPYEEEEKKDVPDLIPDYWAARDYYLGDNDHKLKISDPRVTIPVATFDELMMICNAWNKADGFEPSRRKYNICYFPIYDCLSNAIITDSWDGRLSSPFVFKTETRASQFGNKFIKVLKRFYGIYE